MLLYSLLLGLALARPRPLLGPGGPTWLGPLPPERQDPRGAVIVDPIGAGLVLELPGAAGLFSWEAGAWRRDGEALAGEDPTASSGTDPTARYRLRVEGGRMVSEAELAARQETRGREVLPQGPRWTWAQGALQELIDPQGGRIRVENDAAGRPVRVVWADGSVLRVQWDGFGRPGRLEGPNAGQAQSLRWQDGDLVLREADGASTSVDLGPGEVSGSTMVRLTDAAGRQAAAWFEAGTGRLLGWEDARGLRSRVRWERGRVEVTDAAGRPWRVELDERGQVLVVDEPGGGRWRWRRDGRGEVIGLEDPGGRLHRAERDRQGRLVATGRGAVPWSVVSDAQGRPVELVDPVGSTVRLERDARGRVVRIRDALSNEVRIQRAASGAIELIVDRLGQRWRFERDRLGRLVRVAVGADRQLELRRDASGQLVAVRDGRGRGLDLDRDLRGATWRLRGTDGRSLALERDGQGRLAALRYGEGLPVALRRDLAGEVIQIDRGERSLALQRDLSGAVVRLGALRMERDGAGRVRGLRGAGRELELERDGAGLLRRLRAPGFELELGRDAAGRIVSWQGTDGEVRVRRNPAGRITQEEVRVPLSPSPGQVAAGGEGTPGGGASLSGEPDAAVLEGPPVERTRLEVVLDAMGRGQRFELEGEAWRLLRDAGGRLLRIQGPWGLAFGVDRDEAGRPRLLRHPFQSIRRLDREGGRVRLEVLDPAGRPLASRTFWLDLGGEVEQDEDAAWGTRRWRRDGSGRLLAFEVLERPAWAFGPGGMRGPGGLAVSLDEAGRPALVSGGLGAPAWGLSAEELRLQWSEEGPLRAVEGTGGRVSLTHDGLARLREVRQEPGGAWSLQYDARGRVRAILREGIELHRLVWGPSVEEGLASLLRAGPRGSWRWLPGPWGPTGAAWDAGQGFDELTDPRGQPWWQVDAAGAPSLRSLSPRGALELPAREGADLLGPEGSVQLFSGGPWLVPLAMEGGAAPGGLALEPLSEARLDGLLPWPWIDPWARTPPDAALLDPEAWAAETGQDGPLRLLVAMGSLPAPTGEGWTEPPEDPPPFPGLPASFERLDPPLGPRPGALPLAEDPLTQRFLLACLPGGVEPGWSELLAAILREEAQLPWLPPGLLLPAGLAIGPDGRVGGLGATLASLATLD